MKNRIMMMVLLSAISISFSSCYISRVDVGSNGSYPQIIRNKAMIPYSEVKNVYLFWGLLPISTGQPPLPATGNYTIETSTQFEDGLIYILTDGIFGMRTVKILVKTLPPPTPQAK